MERARAVFGAMRRQWIVRKEKNITLQTRHLARSSSRHRPSASFIPRYYRIPSSLSPCGCSILPHALSHIQFYLRIWSCLGYKIVEEMHSAPLSYKRGVISRRGSRVDNFSRNEDGTQFLLSRFLCLSPRARCAFAAFFPFFAPRFVRGINRERDNVVARASCMTNDTDMACLHEPSRR